MNEKGYGEAAAFGGLAAIAIGVAAWLTHIIVCLKVGSWGFLIAGAIMFPIAIIHGIGIWFGAF